MRPWEGWFTGVPWLGVALFQITLVACLGWLAWLVSRRPAARAAVLLATLVGVLVVPVLGAICPVCLPMPEVGPAAAEGPPAVLVSFPHVMNPDTPEPAARQVPTADAVLPAASVTPTPGIQDEGMGALPPEASPAKTATAKRASGPGRWPVSLWLAAVWLLGTAACTLCALGRLASLYACRARGRRLDEAILTASLTGATHDVEFRECAGLSSPLTLGLGRPIILLPADWRGWSPEQRTLIVAHEYAHIQRRDFLAGLLAELACCLYWFHPLVRWLAGRLRLEQEYAADAWAASRAAEEKHYLRCLARLALAMDRGRASLAPALWRRRPEILRRIDMLRRHPGQAPRLGPWSTCLVGVLAVTVYAVVAGVGYLHSADDQRPTAAAADGARKDPQGDPLPDGALARLGSLRWRHGGPVTFVAYLPDGKAVLTAGQDNIVRLWDAASGKEIRRFTKAEAAAPPPVPVGRRGGWTGVVFRGPSGVALAPDGKVLATIVGLNTIQLWDVHTGKDLRQFQVPNANITAILFAPDSKVLAARVAGETRILDAETGKEISQIKSPQPQQKAGAVFLIGGGGGAAGGMAFSADGKTLATAEREIVNQQLVSYVRLADVRTGKVIRRIDTPATGVSALAYSPDGKLLAYASGETVRLCEPEAGKEIRRMEAPGGVTTLAFSPDSTILAGKGRDQAIRLWAPDTGKEIRQLGEPTAGAGAGAAVFVGNFGIGGVEGRDLAFAPDGKVLAAGGGYTVRRWQLTTGKELAHAGGHNGPVSSLVVTPDGKIVVSYGADNVIRRWDALTGQEQSQLPAPPGTVSAAFSPDGRTAALATRDGMIRLHDLAAGKELHQFKGHANGTATLLFSPDGKTLAARGNPDTILLFDVARGSQLRQIVLGSQVLGNPQGGFGNMGFGGAGGMTLAFSPDGQTLAGHVQTGFGGIRIGAPQPAAPTGPTNTLRLWDIATGKELRQIALPPQRSVVCVAYSPDGRILATENSDRTISLWEIASGKERAQLTTTGAAVAPGPRAVAVVIGGGEVRSPATSTLAFAPDGAMVAFRDADHSVRVWEVDTAREVAQFKGHAGPIQVLGFAPSGMVLASGSSDTTILLWDMTGLKREPRPARITLPAKEVEDLWADLLGDGAATAFRGIQRLARAPEQAVPFLRERLRPAVAGDTGKVAQLIVDLDSQKFQVRNKALAELEKLGEQAVPALRKTLAGESSLEVRRRIEPLLARLTGGPLTAEQLRQVRGVEVLERADTPEARPLLEALARGAPGALLTRHAQGALDTLARQAALRR